MNSRITKKVNAIEKRYNDKKYNEILKDFEFHRNQYKNHPDFI